LRLSRSSPPTRNSTGSSSTSSSSPRVSLRVQVRATTHCSVISMVCSLCGPCRGGEKERPPRAPVFDEGVPAAALARFSHGCPAAAQAGRRVLPIRTDSGGGGGGLGGRAPRVGGGGRGGGGGGGG